jgi:hypothetical protein
MKCKSPRERKRVMKNVLKKLFMLSEKAADRKKTVI